MSPQLSEAVKALIKQARIVSFDWHSTHPPAAISLFQAADDQGRYLSDADFAQLQKLVPNHTMLRPVVQQLRDQASQIVDEARTEVLAAFPTITQPGGGLYPAERADACWRDFWHFLRCITYGIAAQRLDYTSPAGLEAMRRLYQELKVPLDAMVVGLRSIKSVSLQRLDARDQANLAPYFDHLIAKLSEFRESVGAE